MNKPNKKIKYKIRRAAVDDVHQIMNVEKLAWPDGLTATEAMFRSRIETFPEGVLVAETPPDRTLIGVVVAEIINYDLQSPTNKTWYELTDNGNIRKTHDTRGQVLFGVDLSVVPAAQGRGIATHLLDEIGKLVLRRNLPYAMLGGRIPGFHKYAQEMSVEDYVKKTLPSGEFLDPELNFYIEAGLDVVKIVPNYFKDPESLDYGILLKYKNPVYQKNRILGRIFGSIFGLVFKVRR